MTEQKSKLAELFADCRMDETLKIRLLEDPNSVLKEYGLEIPDGIA